jgi:hypothetical protein
MANPIAISESIPAPAKVNALDLPPGVIFVMSRPAASPVGSRLTGRRDATYRDNHRQRRPPDRLDFWSSHPDAEIFPVSALDKARFEVTMDRSTPIGSIPSGEFTVSIGGRGDGPCVV